MLFRYPGAKGKIHSLIVNAVGEYMLSHPDVEYREPMVGSGSIFWNLLKLNIPNSIWVNDRDYGIASIWNCVCSAPDELCAKLGAFKPTPHQFFKFKRQLRRKDLLLQDYVEVGFMKLVIHQISYSGLGTMSGGPLGGMKQESDYKIDCRWNPEGLVRKIRRLHRVLRAALREGCCTYDDFRVSIEAPGDAIIYLDPPYYEKGPELYQRSFTDADHQRLQDLLKASDHPWLLSYDDCPVIKSLYDWAECKVVDINYTINSSRKRTELLIAPKDHAYLLKCEDEVPDLF